MSDDRPAIDARGLAKTFRSHLLRRRIPAAHDVTFQVRRGEVFGLLGPNGAGKTTTLKMLLGLVRPDRGEASILGVPVPEPASREKLGFLPENPYFYDHLTPRELLDYYGSLFGIARATRRRRADALLERLGIGYAADRPIRKMSKGMVQRVGMAQALLSEPEVLVLDEPMSGLDPIGRKEFRDLLLECRGRGAAVLFSSHILPDVEMVADRVAIMNRGTVADQGSLSVLLQRETHGVEVTASGMPEERARALGEQALSHDHRNDVDRFLVETEAQAAALAAAVVEAGGHLIEMVPHRASLEDLLLRIATGRDGDRPA